MAQQKQNDKPEQKNDKPRPKIVWILIRGSNDAAVTKKFRGVPKTMCDKYNGNKLPGLDKDIDIIVSHIKGTKVELYSLDDVITELDATLKATTLDKIKKCAAEQVRHDGELYIYYTGHGQHGTGNWICADNEINIHDIVGAVRKGNKQCNIRIFADCCYSGNMGKTLASLRVAQTGKVSLEAAAKPDETAKATLYGSLWTINQWGRNYKFAEEQLHAFTNDYKGGFGTTYTPKQ